MHDVVVVGVPLIAIFAGALFNNRGSLKLETRIEARLDRMQNEIISLRGEMTSMRSEFHREFEQFYRTLGQHDARIDNLEKRR